MGKRTFHNITYDFDFREEETKTIATNYSNVFLELLYYFFPEKEFNISFTTFYSMNDFDFYFYGSPKYDVGEDNYIWHYSLSNFDRSSDNEIEKYLIACLADLER